jgi:hypothetical protein
MRQQALDGFGDEQTNWPNSGTRASIVPLQNVEDECEK